MRWRIHTGLTAGREAEAAALLASLGDSVQWVTGRKPVDPEHASLENGALALTTIQDARSLLGRWQATPGLYFDLRKYDVSYWLPRVADRIPVLNRGCVFTPLGLVPWIPTQFWTGHLPRSNGLLFVRPDSGLKLFPGFVLDCHARRVRNWYGVGDEIGKEVRLLSPESLICIASGYRLKSLEWRFWIVDRRVVASTPYSWEEGAAAWQEPPTEALQIAAEMAANRWQPDIAYVADVVQLADGDEPFYLNELNAASTSGLYGVPFAPLFEALRDAVTRELAGDLAVED